MIFHRTWLILQVLDGDGDGKISVGDFRYFMTTMGEKMTDEEVEDMLQSVYRRKHGNFDSIEYSGKSVYRRKHVDFDSIEYIFLRIDDTMAA